MYLSGAGMTSNKILPPDSDACSGLDTKESIHNDWMPDHVRHDLVIFYNGAL
jgi:hypothetical protein